MRHHPASAAAPCSLPCNDHGGNGQRRTAQCPADAADPVCGRKLYAQDSPVGFCTAGRPVTQLCIPLCERHHEPNLPGLCEFRPVQPGPADDCSGEHLPDQHLPGIGILRLPLFLPDFPADLRHHTGRIPEPGPAHHAGQHHSQPQSPFPRRNLQRKAESDDVGGFSVTAGANYLRELTISKDMVSFCLSYLVSLRLEMTSKITAASRTMPLTTFWKFWSIPITLMPRLMTPIRTAPMITPGTVPTPP